jgi:hypothetical protein
MFRALCAHRQEVKIVLYSIWYNHTETNEWSKITKITKITKIQFYKYEHIVVKIVCEFFGCDYCVLLTVNMLWHVEVDWRNQLRINSISSWFSLQGFFTKTRSHCSNFLLNQTLLVSAFLVHKIECRVLGISPRNSFMSHSPHRCK